MPKDFEFVAEINGQTWTWTDYRKFIRDMRVLLREGFSHNCPVLPIPVEPPTRFFDLVIRTNNHSVRFRLRMDNLYLIGYQMENTDWLEFGKNAVNKKRLINTSAFLGFGCNYNSLLHAANMMTMDNIGIGYYDLMQGINELATSTDGSTRARFLIVVIMMTSESIRLKPVSDYTAKYFNTRSDKKCLDGLIPPWITVLVRSWGTFSEALLRADADPTRPFQIRPNNVRVPPDNREIRTIADVTEIIGILLGLCFTHSGPRRFPRMASDEGQCFLGLPLVEVFSVRIDNIDGEDPGQLYGTITVNDGLNTEYIYNRTSSNTESIQPGQNASLTGPSQSILAIGNFTIKLLLTDKDTWSWDDEIINEDISWDAFEIGNVYDEHIFQKLDGNRGSVTVNYAVLRNAVAARITVTLEEGGERTTNVYGKVDAHYNDWNDPNTTCLLFNRSSDEYVDVRRRQNIPLLRSVVAVPLNGSLIVTASLYDKDTFSRDDEIANGTVEFPAEMSGTSSMQIQGEDGNWVTVTVYWTCQI